jgi:hypothetical protein
MKTLVVERPLTRPGSLDSGHLGVIRTSGGTIQRSEEATQKLLRRHPDSSLDPDLDEITGFARQTHDAEVTSQVRNQGGSERAGRVC